MYTAIPYRARTGPEQGFPCVVFPHRENPVVIAGFPVSDNRFFPVGNTTQAKPCFHYRDGFAVRPHAVDAVRVSYIGLRRLLCFSATLIGFRALILELYSCVNLLLWFSSGFRYGLDL